MNNSTPSPNAEMQVESSLIFLTHPTVTSNLKKWVKFDLEEIQLAKTRAPVWTMAQGFNKENISRETYILVFGGSIDESDFNPNIVNARWDASITNVKRPGQVKGRTAPTQTLYRERPAAAIPPAVEIGNVYVPNAKVYDAVSGSKQVGQVKAVRARKDGKPVGVAYAQTINGPRAYVEETPQNAVKSAREDLKTQIIRELVKTTNSIDQKIYELRKESAPQEELRAWMKKRQQVNEVLAVYSH